MSWHLPRARFLALLALILSAGLTIGCTSLLDSLFDDALLPDDGALTVKGLSGKVTVQRNDLGLPVITAENLDDLVFAQGFVSAGDRLTQMASFRLAAQGRLAELTGRPALETDFFLRALNIGRAAQILYDNASPDLQRQFQNYSNGVNAYLDLYRDRLPRALTMSGYTPEKWRPVDSAAVFVLISLGLAQNIYEEVDILNLARVLGPEKTAWLIPIYPDEPLPFPEFAKLKQIDFSGTAATLEKMSAVSRRLQDMGLGAVAASNNWAVSGQRTASGKSLLANDTHLSLLLPSMWHIMHLRCPELSGAGICLAGAPGVVAGYNGHVAWGMTMVMADNQDLFIERLQKKDDGLYYLHQDQWHKAAARTETFVIKGEKPVTRTIHETVHGVLINDILTAPPINELVPLPAGDPPFGIALQWAAFEADQSLDAFFNLLKATTVDQAVTCARAIRTIPLNMVLADANNIAWQVTGRYPIRKNGRGLCPSPGWTGEYDWQGFVDPADHPFAVNPERGFCATANHRVIPKNSPRILSSSWYYPDRAARIYQMIEEAGKYNFEEAKKMQLDVQAPFSAYIRELLFLDRDITQALNKWPDKEERLQAVRGLSALNQFNGELTADSPGAAFYGAFLHCLSENIFADELGGTTTIAWQSLLDTYLVNYSALHDHLFPRCAKSPFWDDINTPGKETRGDILAKTVHDAVRLLDEQCGPDPDQWRWGDLHTYHWQTDTSRMAPHLGWSERLALKWLAPYLDRGPYPAPGDHLTLNVAGYHPGRDFNAWLIPAMRIIVDFGQAEPLHVINSSGQSDNPASPHYDDGIQAWLNGEYRPLPFDPAAIEKACPGKLALLPG